MGGNADDENFCAASVRELLTARDDGYRAKLQDLSECWSHAFLEYYVRDIGQADLLKIRQSQRLRLRSENRTVNMSMQLALSKLKPCLSTAAYSLISAQVRLRNKTVRHWTDSERLIAMSVYYQSPKAYRFLSKILKLPSKASINRWLQTVRVESGINWYMIKLLESKVKHFSDVDRQCVLLMDEMSVKKGLRYCKMRDLVVGYVDNGTERKPEVATSALVFMIRGIFQHWKQAVSFSFTSDSLQSSEVKQLIVQIFTALQETGLKIIGTSRSGARAGTA